MTYKLSDVVYENVGYWVKQVKHGYEIYKTGATHSVRVGIVGFTGEAGLKKSIDEISRRMK